MGFILGGLCFSNAGVMGGFGSECLVSFSFS